MKTSAMLHTPVYAWHCWIGTVPGQRHGQLPDLCPVFAWSPEERPSPQHPRCPLLSAGARCLPRSYLSKQHRCHHLSKFCQRRRCHCLQHRHSTGMYRGVSARQGKLAVASQLDNIRRTMRPILCTSDESGTLVMHYSSSAPFPSYELLEVLPHHPPSISPITEI